MEFLAGIMHAVQAGNWQRGGGKGSRPKPWKRPRDFAFKNMPKSREELSERQQKQGAWLRKRREQKRLAKEAASG